MKTAAIVVYYSCFISGLNGAIDKPFSRSNGHAVMVIKKPYTILDEMHATRRKLSEATKDMTSSERTA